MISDFLKDPWNFQLNYPQQNSILHFGMNAFCRNREEAQILQHDW